MAEQTMPMASHKHIIIIHGYILAGTGSNIYTLNVAKAWLKQGYGVTIVCQDLNAASYNFVDEYYGPETSLDLIEKLNIPNPGVCRVFVPDIDFLLPVYVYDVYEGYSVKTIPDCTPEECENHINKTAAGLKAVACGTLSRPPACFVLTNHALFSPVIASRALTNLNIPYSCKMHGSGLTFVLQPYPRFLSYSIEGLKNCSQIIAGTLHIVDRMNEVFGEENAILLNFKKKMTIVPPGMDANIFKPLYDSSFEANIKEFHSKIEEYLKSNPNGRNSCTIGTFPALSENYHNKLTDRGNKYDQRTTDCDLISRFPWDMKQNEPIIMYFGKFLNTKGVGEILVSFLGKNGILQQIPNTRLICIGFGGFREHLESLLDSMLKGDKERFIASGKADNFIDTTVDLESYFRKITIEDASRVTITGILNHSQLSLLLPLASLVIVGSKAAEAFGMVAAEAMCCGVLPLVNYHSGIIDVINEVKSIDESISEMMIIETKQGGFFKYADGKFFMESLIPKISAALKYLYGENCEFDKNDRRFEIGKKLRNIATEKFLWDNIAKRLLEKKSAKM